MAEVLGVGLSHYPPFSSPDESMASLLRDTLEDPDIPADAKDVAQWPELAQAEWGDGRDLRAASAHRASLLAGFEQIRRAIDDFEPDAIVIWGDDQYENFHEDVIPPYAILAYDDMTVRPWAQAAESSMMKGTQNVWGEPADTEFLIRGRPDIARHLITGLLESSVDVSYAYKPLHHPGLPHAFLNTLLYLDYHRKGFDYPIIPFPINCYGRRVVSYRGFTAPFADVRELDPPSPSPARLMDIGERVGRICAESPWRIALIASSSWSHAFMCDKTWRLRPDIESDRSLYDALVAGDHDTWRGRKLSEIEEAGQQELLNWFPLVGAMNALQRPRPAWSDFVETAIFNSNKVFVIYEPTESLRS